VVGTGSGGLVFSIAGTEQARLTSGGNFLLGATSDTGERLKVQGNAALSGTLAVGSTITAPTFSGNLTGNASTVTNGVYTTGSYSDPSSLLLTKSKVGLGNVENTALSTWAGSTSITTLGTVVTGTLPWANVSGKPTFASANTASAVVQRDGSGNFSAGTITATLSGNASTATALAANGSNCSAGQAALGVSASGAAEGCYDPSTYRSGQINFVYGGSASTAIDATTVNNLWRAHAHQAAITEIACWTDAGTVSLTMKDSAGNAVASALTCSTSGASMTTINAYGALTYGEGLGFTTASVSGVKNLSVSIKYTRSY
jgi:hypothetical protein